GGQLADERNDASRIGGEGAWLEILTDGSEHGPPFPMARIENATQFFVHRQERVPFVDQKGWPLHLDDAEDRGCRRIRGQQWPHAKPEEHGEEGGFPAPLPGWGVWESR